MVLTATRRVVRSPQLERGCARNAARGVARSPVCRFAAASLPPPPGASLLPPYSEALLARDRGTRGRRRAAFSAGERARADREPLRRTGGLHAALCSVSSSTLSTRRILLVKTVVCSGLVFIPA